jgi:hypothetical protein
MEEFVDLSETDNKANVCHFSCHKKQIIAEQVSVSDLYLILILFVVPAVMTSFQDSALK